MKTSLQMRIQFFTGLFQGFRIECTVHTVHADLSALIPLRVQGYKCKSSLENTSDPCPGPVYQQLATIANHFVRKMR